jgi:amino acid adenylation domain-containing protein
MNSTTNVPNQSNAPDVKTEAVDYDPFAGDDVARVVPTTEPQREIWLADQLSREASLAYNESVMLRFTGDVNLEALQQALNGLVNRHEALRSTISANGEELCIAASLVIEVPVVDVRAKMQAEQSRVLEESRIRVVETQFSLEKGPLFRAEVLRLSQEVVLILTAHHIVCDGWSFDVLVHELQALYATASGSPAAALATSDSYADYAIQQRAPALSEQVRADEAYWLPKFAGTAPVLDLPTDRARGTWRTFTSRREDYVFDAALTSAIKKMGAAEGASLFATMLGAFFALLNRLTHAEDIVVGIPAAGQSASGLDMLVGHCVNLLPMRVQLDRDTRVKSLLAATRSTMLDGYDHQGYTFGSLLKKIVVERDPSRLPLVNVVFNIDSEIDTAKLKFPGLSVKYESNPRRFENFELFINVVQQKGELCLECQYNSDLFDAETIRRWCRHYEMLVRSMCESPASTVGKLQLLTDADRNVLLSRHAVTERFPVAETLHARFARQVLQTPDAIAVVCDGATLSYRELDERANQLAHHLKALGAGPEVLVGLHLERSLELVIGIMGILKAGAAYLPLDPSYPGDRLSFILGDAKSPILVTQSSLAAKLPALTAKIVSVDSDKDVIAANAKTAVPDAATPQSLAYVIYTSGSTGKPKGVQIEHANVIRLFTATDKWYGFGASDVWTLFHSFAFDFSVWEIWGALLYGGKLVIVPYMVSRSPDAFHELLANEGVTVLNQTPSAFRQLIAADQEAPRDRKLRLRHVVFGGEALDTRSLLPWYERYADDAPRLVNMYGITETTVHVTYRELRKEDASRNSSPIGEPIPDLSLYLLDGNLEPVPIGVAGELYVGGAGLARGYLNRDDLTATRFIPHPFERNTGARLYKSGDVARYLANGSLEFVGRADTQVKVRGHRIELGEIDATLAKMDGIGQAVTIVREDRPGDVRLVAYLVARGAENPADDAIRAHLKKTLPEYMVPAHFIALKAIPLTANGKLDKKALPPPSVTAKQSANYVAPETELQKVVAAEMETSLGMRGIGLHDDFFTMGGHSLLAAQMTARLNKSYGTRLSMRHIFEAPTVAKLADVLARETAKGASKSKPITRLADQRVAPLSLTQERMWFLEQLHPGRVTYHGPSAHRLTGPMNASAFERAFAEMIRRQPSLRTRFVEEGGDVVQHVMDDIDLKLFPAEDLSHLEKEAREAKLFDRLNELTAKTFVLTEGPMFRAHMFKLGPEEHALFFMAHHIIWDGWSFDLLYTEMSNMYSAFAEGRANPLQPLALSYGDFAAWHRDWVQGDEFKEQLGYWRTRLKQIGAARELPTDMPRKPGMSGAGSNDWILIDRQTTEQLHETANRSGGTMFNMLLGVYCMMLFDYARQTNVVVGTPVRGRNFVELESIMGYFNNLLPLQLEIDPNETFANLVKRIKALVVESLRYSDVPLEQLASEIGEMGRGNAVLYQALFSFQDARQRITRWGQLDHQNILIFQRGATEDLGMWFVETHKGMHGAVNFNSDILKAETVKRMMARYVEFLQAIIKNQDAKIIELVGEAVAPAVTHASLPAAAPVSGAPRAQAQEALTTATEKLLAEIWCAELRLPSVGRADNFFDLGGHSLLTMQVMAKMEEKTGKRINPQKFIFETLGQIARAYDEESAKPQTQKKGFGKFLAGLVGSKSS